MSLGQNVVEAPMSVSAEQAAEIAMLIEQISRLDRGELDPDEFKRFRLENGIYGIRGAPDQHMVRVKVRYGRLTAGQLETLADIAEAFTPNGKLHLTTRQDVQFHYIKRYHLPRVLTLLAEAGLTTREACGNTVRNVTACPFSGVSSTEVFDVRPYADALSLYFLRNPINQNLPRKFKFAFEGCTEDHARTPIHDFGAVAAIRGSDGAAQRGFRIYLGGGLGAQPASARLLEDFTPENLLIPTAEAVLRIFDRYGERREDHSHRMRARLKFLIREWGWEKFRAAVLKERQVALLTQSGRGAVRFNLEEEEPPFGEAEVHRLTVNRVSGRAGTTGGDHNLRSLDRLQSEQRYSKWSASNLIPQKQKGWVTAIVRAPLGDLSVEDLRHVARIARSLCGGRVQVSISQNLMLRWVPGLLVRHVYDELDQVGLTRSGAHQLADITRCPGADTCQIAITHSRGLAEVLAPIVENGLGEFPELQQLSIKISGCMNSCGQHHVADIGFYGASENVRGHELPKYVVMLGGRTREGLAEFAVPIAQIPARLVPAATKELLIFYRENKEEAESFRDFVDRLGKQVFRTLLSRYQPVTSYEDSRDLFRDLGVDEEFKVVSGVGECAGVTTEITGSEHVQVDRLNTSAGTGVSRHAERQRL
ncbi:MAG TPA: nitrite/sulfite reductase [Acidobacteriota bacterium]|nr:nitrite/sulfite reductase [Acidobacteriota bacterium]